MDVYTNCPHFIAQAYTLRPVCMEDAPGLLKVYQDKTAHDYFNTDNLPTDLRYAKLSEMENCIRMWMRAREKREYIRWTIFRDGRPAGTLEMRRLDDGHDGRGRGVLRIDMMSRYEFSDVFDDIMRTTLPELHTLFDSNRIMIKSLPFMVRRRLALVLHGFMPCKDILIGDTGIEYGNYWSRRNIP